MWNFLAKLISNGILKIIIPLCSTVKAVLMYLNRQKEENAIKKKKEDLEKDCNTIDDVCNNGTIDDLLNIGDKMTKVIILLIGGIVFNGCVNITPSVQTTNYWEKHYMTTNDFYKGTQNIHLKEGESIWVLSNTTLSNLLKDVRGK